MLENYTISYTNTYFTDINECDDSSTYCSDNTKCINLDGAYDCACLDGFVSNGDGNEFKDGPGCGEQLFFCVIYIFHKFDKLELILNFAIILSLQCRKRTTVQASLVRMEELVSTQQEHITVIVPITGQEGTVKLVRHLFMS